jgi:HPr kinase/phosphorylase
MNPRKIQGVLVSVHGVGVLIRGRAGSGKSLSALNLMRRGHFLIADDVVEIVPHSDGSLVGRALESDVRIEVRGLGVFRARSLFPDGILESCRIDFVVELDTYDPARDAGRLTPDTALTTLLERDILTVRAPLPAGVDPALLIEMLTGLFKRNGTVTE